MTNLINPMLDEDEEFDTSNGPVNPLLDDDEEDHEPRPRFTVQRPTAAPAEQPADRKPWEKPVRTAEEEAELEDRKEAGDVPSGKKKRRNSMTAKDMILLAALSTFRVMTAEQLSLLLTTSGVHGNTAGQMASPKTVYNRLLRLKEIGAVQDKSIWEEQRIWGVTNFGRGAAIASGLVGRPGQIQKKGISGLNYTELPHNLAVNWVAAQLLSPFGFHRDLINLPPQLDFTMLRSEYEVQNAWMKMNARLSAENKIERATNPNARERKFKDWRSEKITALHAAVAAGETSYRHIADDEPALWALGQTPVAGDELREHHIPDLIINLERFRKGPARGSVAIEVELNAKSVASYKKQLILWAADLQKFKGYPDPILIKELIYFYVDDAVDEHLREADAKAGTSLFASGKLKTVRLTGRDGKTPLNLTTRVSL